MTKTQLSMLDLVAVREGSTVAQAIATAVQTAQHAEQLGFTRYWLAEHHNMPGLACSSTAVLVEPVFCAACGAARFALCLCVPLCATQADELMLVCDIFDPALRLRALDIAAGFLQ